MKTYSSSLASERATATVPQPPELPIEVGAIA